MEWHRSSAFCENGACVEVAFEGDVVAVRDSGDPEIMIKFGCDEWRGFVAKVKSGAFTLA